MLLNIWLILELICLVWFFKWFLIIYNRNLNHILPRRNEGGVLRTIQLLALCHVNCVLCPSGVLQPQGACKLWVLHQAHCPGLSNVVRNLCPRGELTSPWQPPWKGSLPTREEPAGDQDGGGSLRKIQESWKGIHRPENENQEEWTLQSELRFDPSPVFPLFIWLVFCLFWAGLLYLSEP